MYDSYRYQCVAGTELDESHIAVVAEVVGIVALAVAIDLDWDQDLEGGQLRRSAELMVETSRGVVL